jgi:uncharacterized membrane protein
MDNPLFLIPFLIGITLLVAGLILLNYPPKKINSLYGYRTASSMKSKERWDFAQRYSSIELIKISALLVLFSLIGIIYYPSKGLAMVLAFILLLLSIVILIIRVEKAIKKRFDN